VCGFVLVGGECCPVGALGGLKRGGVGFFLVAFFCLVELN